MKNQYFGDTRDLFKYDLCLELLLKTSIRKFLFIPMLTPNDGKTHGSHTNYKRARAGLLRKDLVEFLKKCVVENKRDISMLEIFFKKFNKENLVNFEDGIRLYIYKKNEYFLHKNRREYFQEIPAELLKQSLILVDPDNGLEVKSRTNLEKYLLYSELKALYEKMDKHSMLVIFQFIPRVNRSKYFEEILRKIKDTLDNDAKVLFISDNQIVFFVILKDKDLYTRVRFILKNYAKTYKLLFGGENIKRVP